MRRDRDVDIAGFRGVPEVRGVRTRRTTGASVGTRLAMSRRMGTRRTRFAESSSLISDDVPTCCDEVTNVTRLEIARVMRALDMTNDTSTQPTAMDDVFADAFTEDTLELFIDYDVTC